MITSAEVKRLFMTIFATIAWSLAAAAEEERIWDQERARDMVATVLKVEASGKRPWNSIPWRADPGKAAAEAKKSGKPLFVYFYVAHGGPPPEPCCPGGRMMRAVALADTKVQWIVKRNFIPVKLPIDPAEGFTSAWPALRGWATAYKFANGKGFTGCSVISPDLEFEYGHTGSAFIWEMFDSTAYSPRKFAAMLERSASRAEEERALRYQRGITPAERKLEVARLRKGLEQAVRREGQFHLPPRGFSLDQALELFRIVGAVDGE
ncbi:MAG: hypothetical protein HKN82_16080 [Akkermansiaceae bacterium]|nr:hypothetical protein [Akkermansiaceae bacterium]